MSRTINPWPYAILCFFGVFIAAVAGFIIFALRQDMDLVRADYYEQEVRFQEQIDRVNRTDTVKSQVAADYDAPSGILTVALPATHRLGAEGQIQLYRASDAKLDRTFPITSGMQTLRVGELHPGPWKLRLKWRAGGEEFYFEKLLYVSRANE